MKKHLTIALALLTLICTSAQAQLPSYLPADGLVGWWPFNGNANDESGNGNDGVVNGATLAEDRNGISSAAYSFDGVGNNIVVQNQQSLNPNSITLNVWVFPLSNDRCIIKKSNIINASEYGYGLTHNDQFQFQRGLLTRFGRGTCSSVSDSDAYWSDVDLVQNNSWSMVTATIDINGEVRHYVNGVLVYTTQTSPLFSCDSETSTLRFGGQHWNNDPEWFDGLIDDIAIYNRALSEAEIQNIYTATNTGSTVDTGDGASPLPQGIPYQAAARDGNGQPVADSPVNVRFSLHEGAADGATSYIESHGLTTNSIGLFNTVFGNGTPEQSAFDSINWAATTKFLQVEVDLGNGYVDMGTTQLLSVPYAFRSAQAATLKNAALPIYPDNTAALAGGLVAGEMYRTASGDLKIVY